MQRYPFTHSGSSREGSCRDASHLRLDTQMTSISLDVSTPVLEEAPITPKSKSGYESRRRGRYRRRLGGSIHERVRAGFADLLDWAPSGRLIRSLSLFSAVFFLYTFTTSFQYMGTVITSLEESTGVTTARLGHWLSHWSGTLPPPTPSHPAREPMPVIKLSPRPVRIKSHDELLHDNAAALESWMQFGVLPAGHSVDFSAHTKIDSITYWVSHATGSSFVCTELTHHPIQVNGSDPRHRQARRFYAEGAERVVAAPPANSSALPLATKEDRDKAGEYRENVKKFLQNSENRFREANEL